MVGIHVCMYVHLWVHAYTSVCLCLGIGLNSMSSFNINYPSLNFMKAKSFAELGAHQFWLVLLAGCLPKHSLCLPPRHWDCGCPPFLLGSYVGFRSTLFPTAVGFKITYSQRPVHLAWHSIHMCLLVWLSAPHFRHHQAHSWLLSISI